MPAKRTREKAFAYLRVSGKGQVRGDGFPRQTKAWQGKTVNRILTRQKAS